MKTVYKYVTMNIYRILWITPLWILLFVISSCESFTEIGIPQTELIGSTIFEDAATADAALADIYARMREGGVASGTSVSGTSLMANYTDDMDFYGSNALLEQFNKHTMLTTNTTLLGLWNTSYAQIYAINALLEGVSASESIAQADKDRLIGEALFLRGFVYFYLTNLFGDLPYMTGTDYRVNAIISKTSSNQVCQNILADLLEAEGLLPEDYPTSERIRVNKAVCEALLARVYLYMENYGLALEYANLLINNPMYTVEPNPEAAFLKDSPSIIWSFHPGAEGLNTKDASAYNFSSGPPTKPALSLNLYNAFEPGDLRKTFWIKIITNSNGSWYRPYKYKQVASTSPSQEYTILLRIEEQYLIRAEAKAMTGDIAGAREDLNVIRTRAGLQDTAAQAQPELLAAILQERRMEFFTELSHRWFDLKRTGSAASVLAPLKPQWQDRDLLLPIPENELLLNENLLPQNSGY